MTNNFSFFNIMDRVNENSVEITVSGRYISNADVTRKYFMSISNAEIDNFIENGINALNERFYDLGYFVDEVKVIDSHNTYDFTDLLEW